MRILVSGASGWVGMALCLRLAAAGDAVVRLVRPEAGAGEDGARWDVAAGTVDGGAEEADALVHLAGASIADGRWTAERKRVLWGSRVEATRGLMSALEGLRRPPAVIVAASAVGYYGDRGDEKLTEASAAGSGFLADLSRAWEAETTRAETWGARVVKLRFGVILAGDGGALPRMAAPFRLGVGGRLGSGRQWMAWLTLAEAVNMIRFALREPGLSGPVNAVTPAPVRNATFTRALARSLRRPAALPAPGWALRLALGEMADALLLTSQRVIPAKIAACGYNFLETDVDAALRAAQGEAA